MILEYAKLPTDLSGSGYGKRRRACRHGGRTGLLESTSHYLVPGQRMQVPSAS
jgi:hypothetical protein